LEKRPHGSEYQPYPYLDYLLGCAKMNRLDSNAYNYFSKFLQERGTSFIKDSYLHLGWNCLLHDDVRRYEAFTQLVKTKGYTFNEKDKQALNEANNPVPNIQLLKARLLYDGGYYEKALGLLHEADFKQPTEKTEYYYRLGRIYEALNKNEEALQAYQQCINTGGGTGYYYAPTSALRMGNIYEREKNASKAVKYYNMAIAFKNHQDESSIEKRANEGLKRLGY
jgi:tetratricopeptide (TPR) repeat protein